jgi:epoxyqueuosine reductase QueG
MQNNIITQEILQQIKVYLINKAKQLHLEISIADLDVSKASINLHNWLKNNMHGTMEYMQKHAYIRTNPTELLTTAVRAIMVRLNYNYLSYPELKQELNNLYDYKNIDDSGVLISPLILERFDLLI